MKSKPKICFVVAPDGQVGGGMGRVKDYILSARLSSDSELRFVPLITRDQRGPAFSLLQLLVAILTIWREAIFGRVGLVHVNFGDNGSALRKTLIIAAAFVARVPVLLHLHAVEIERQYRGGGKLLRMGIALPFRMSTSIAVLGVRWKRWLADDLHIPEEKIDVLWNGVPITLPSTTAGAVHDGVIRVLFLGNLMERKGVTDLLTAMSLLVQRADWCLLMAGGGDIAHYRKTASNLGIEERVRFLGWLNQDDARSALLSAGMLVLPSYEEGLPLVILEALGLGTPVVCTPVGSIPEVLKDGESALFSKPGDQAGLSSAINRLLDDQSLREAMSANGRALYSRLFSLEAFHASLAAIYQKRFGMTISFQAPE